MSNKVLLMILDGWGNGHHDKADVIWTVHPAYISAMTEKYPHAELRTDGENVGLPDGQMGNSEVGHLNIGAGRVVYQDLVKINRACRDNSILKNPEVADCRQCRRGHLTRCPRSADASLAFCLQTFPTEVVVNEVRRQLASAKSTRTQESLAA